MENNEGKIFEIPKWEYKKIRLYNDDSYKELSELGKKGWDSVGVLNGVSTSPDLLLKRQIGTVGLWRLARSRYQTRTVMMATVASPEK